MDEVFNGTPATEIVTIEEEGEEILILGNGGDDLFNVIGDDDDPNQVTVVTGSGNDALNVTFGNGVFRGGAGNDTLNAVNANFFFDGEAGIDILDVGAELDDLRVVSTGNVATISSIRDDDDDEDEDDDDVAAGDDDDDDDAPTQMAGDDDDDDDDDAGGGVGDLTVQTVNVETFVFGELIVRQNDGNALGFAEKSSRH